MCCLLRDKLFMALIFFSLHKEVNSHKISLQSPMYKKIVCLGYSGEILVALDRSCKIALVHFRYYYFFDIVKKKKAKQNPHTDSCGCTKFGRGLRSKMILFTFRKGNCRLSKCKKNKTTHHI